MEKIWLSNIDPATTECGIAKVTEAGIVNKRMVFKYASNNDYVYVNYLRNKLDKGYEEKLIQTKFGHGYIFGQK